MRPARLFILAALLFAMPGVALAQNWTGAPPTSVQAPYGCAEGQSCAGVPATAVQAPYGCGACQTEAMGNGPGCPACGPSCGGQTACPSEPCEDVPLLWRPTPLYARAELTYLHLEPDADPHGTVLIDVNTLEPVLRTGDFTFDFRPGIQVTVGTNLSPVVAVEASYFGLQHWEAAQDLNGTGNLGLPGDLGLTTNDFSGTDHVRVVYSADIHSGELNMMRAFELTRLYLLAGFRYINFAERFAIDAGANGGGANSTYAVDTQNSLYGGQIGVVWMQRLNELIELDLIGKGGCFNNDARQTAFLGDFNNSVVLRNVDVHQPTTSYLGQLGLNASVKVSPNTFLRASYNALWITNLTRAPSQLDFTNTAASNTVVRTDRQALLHGFTAGFEFQW